MKLTNSLYHQYLTLNVHREMAANPANHTVLDAIVLCGVNHQIMFNRATAAERISTEIFDDDFSSCMDKSMKELDADLAMYSALTVANGQIRLTPGITKKIKAFM